MKKKILLFLLIMGVAASIVGLDHDQAHAWARAQIGGAGQGAFTWTACGGANGACPGCADPKPGAPPKASICNSTNGPTDIEARATTAVFPGGWRLKVAIDATIAAGDWIFGKGSPGFSVTAFAKDTVYMEIDTTLVGNLIRRVNGKMVLYPRILGNSWMNFELKGGNTDLSTVCFQNMGILSNDGLTITGTPPISFTTSVVNDTVYANISDEDTISCSVPRNQLNLSLDKKERVTNVPIFSHWGMVILVLLLMTSAVIILLKRRKATATA